MLSPKGSEKLLAAEAAALRPQQNGVDLLVKAAESPLRRPL